MATKLSSILDIYGRPIESEVLEDVQTNDAKLASLQRTYSSHPSSGLNPGRLAAIMKSAEDGDLKAQCDLAEDMEEKDAHIQSELGKRKMALQGVNWSIKPPRNATAAEKADADLIQELLEDATWLDDAIFDMSDATLKSFSNLEIKWGFAENTQYIQSVEYKDPAWFKTHPDRRNELRIRDGSYEGAQLQPFGWIQHTAKAKSGYVSRRGLVRTLAWPFLFKNYSVRDLAEFLEIYGLPIRLGKYPTGATNAEKATLMHAVMSIGHNAGGILPTGMDIDFQNAATGQSDPFMAMIAWCEKSQSKAILGGTLTSQADGKSSTNALGNVHNEVRTEIRNFDLQRIAATLTRDVVYPLYALNGKVYQNPRRHPRFEFDIAEAEDTKKLSESLPGLVGLGMRIPLQWIHDKTQIPQAKDDEEILKQQTPSVSQAAAPAEQSQTALSAESTLKTVLKESDKDVVDDQVSTLNKSTSNLFDALQSPIREMVESATSLSALREDILSLSGSIGIDELGETMAQALAAAELAGIDDVNEGK